MERMIAIFGQQGIVEAREGVRDVPDLPETIYVETVAPSLSTAVETAAMLATAPAETTPRGKQLQRSGWGTEEHLQDAVNLRRRK